MLIRFLTRYNRLLPFLVFCVIGIGYYATSPSNRTESDDGYWYADVIKNAGYRDLFYTRFLIFLPLNRLIFLSFTSIGISIDPFQLMSWLSIICACASVIILYQYLTGPLKFNRTTSTFGALFLALGYGFWRYSSEAEVYAISTFLVLLGLIILEKVRHHPTLWHTLIFVALGSFSTLLYKPNFIPFFLAFPVILLRDKLFRSTMTYYGMSGIIIIMAYYFAHSIMRYPPSDFVSGFLMAGGSGFSSSMISSMPVIGANQVGFNWVYGFESVTSLIQQATPFKVIEEEIFMGDKLGDLKYLGLVTFLILISIALTNLYWAITRFNKPQTKDLLVCITWIVLYFLFVSFFDPTSYEPWLMLEVPLIILFTAWLVRPVVLAGKKKLMILFIGMLFCHNMIGGLYPIYSSESDYYYQKSSWIRSNADAGDLILVLGPMGLVRYIRYYTDAKVLNVEENIDLMKSWIEKTQNKNGNIYLTDDMLNPPKAIIKRSALIQDALSEEINKYDLQVVYSGDYFKTFKILRKKD